MEELQQRNDQPLFGAHLNVLSLFLLSSWLFVYAASAIIQIIFNYIWILLTI